MALIKNKLIIIDIDDIDNEISRSMKVFFNVHDVDKDTEWKQVCAIY